MFLRSKQTNLSDDSTRLFLFDTTRGMTFMDVIIGILLIGLVFYGLFGVFKLSLELIVYSKTKSGALALATQRLEYLRSLPYDEVGTVGGIPSGSLPQVEVQTINGVAYTTRTVVQYTDAPQDGLAENDENGITADYKVAKVEMQWLHRSATSSVSLITNIVPRGVESLSAGGTLRINVFDTTANPVSSAQVRVVNNSVSPAIDTTVFTNISGSVTLPGAPPGTGYEITVSKLGYSTAQTYSVTAGNPNPNPGHLTVTNGNTTTASFAIDYLSSQTLVTIEPVERNEFFDTFTDASNIAESSSTVVSGGALTLESASSTYATTGFATTTTISASPLYGWDRATTTITTPPNTSLSYQFFSATSGTFVLIPDSMLPGNSGGLTASSQDLSNISATLYPILFAVFSLESDDGINTPEIQSFAVGYFEGPTPITGVTLSVRGDKTIGVDGSGVPVYKYQANHTTNANGEAEIEDLEWDTYTTNINSSAEGYDITESCPPQPVSINPDEATVVQLTLEPNFVRSLLVVVRGSDVGLPVVEGADVTLSRSGYNETESSSACGSAFFKTPPSASDYQLSVSHPSYQTTVISPIQIAGDEVQEVVLPLL